MTEAEPSSRVPPLTSEKLRGDHPEGTRHQAKIDIAMSLIGNGIPPSAAAVTLREKFPFATDREINDVIDWAIAHDPKPSGGENYHGTRKPENWLRGRARAPEAPQKASDSSPSSHLRNLRDWLGEALASEDDVVYASQAKLPADFRDHAGLLASHLYSPTELINIVVAFLTTEQASGKVKANPHGPGQTLTASGWVDWFKKKGPPFMKAGAWVRPNPVTEKNGSGKGGAFMDADVKIPRFILLESDCLPLQYQLTAMAVFKLPIAAIITSGGSSCHAWVKVDCETATEFEEVADRIFKGVERFGFDCANRNPSRLARLPGVVRGLGAGEDPRQRLIYLNPSPSWKAIL